MHRKEREEAIASIEAGATTLANDPDYNFQLRNLGDKILELISPYL